ncbi:hypothetical protein Gotur_030660 [Gossypium turneri]
MLTSLICFSAPLASTPVWKRDFSSSEELITEFCRECRISMLQVRQPECYQEACGS